MSDHTLKRLRHLTRAYEHWQQGIGYLKLSRLTSDPNVQERLVRIAQQYRSLAETDVPVGSGFPALRPELNAARSYTDRTEGWVVSHIHRKKPKGRAMPETMRRPTMRNRKSARVSSMCLPSKRIGGVIHQNYRDRPSDDREQMSKFSR